MRSTTPTRPPVRRSPPPPVAESGSVRPARISYPRALAAGLGVSVALHLVVLLWASGTRVLVSISSGPASAVTVRGARGAMRVERMVPVPDAGPGDDGPTGRERREASPPERPPDLAVDPPPEPPSDEAGRDATAADRLAPRMGDRRLWERVAAPQIPSAAERGDVDRVRSSLARRVSERSDSLDWAIEGEGGGKWGISPGKIHLGGWTSPGQIQLGPSPWQRHQDDTNDRARMEREIADQIARARALEGLEARIRAVREQKDREREEKKKSGSGSGAG